MKKISKSPILTALSAVVALLFSVPVAWILIDSFRPTSEIAATMSSLSWRLFIPGHVSLGNYTGIIRDDAFGRALFNSAVMSVGSVVIGLILSVAAAYALAAFRFKGREILFGIIVIGFMVPFDAIAIPLAQQFTDWGLANTYIGLILPGIGNGLAVFNLRQHFLGIPREYREAALLDGAAEPRILWNVYVPMSGASLVNSGMLIFIAQWVAYLWPLLIVTDNGHQVAPVSLAETFGQHVANYGQTFAGTVMLAVIPAVILFGLQRFFGRMSFSSGVK